MASSSAFESLPSDLVTLSTAYISYDLSRPLDSTRHSIIQKVRCQSYPQHEAEFRPPSAYQLSSFQSFPHGTCTLSIYSPYVHLEDGTSIFSQPLTEIDLLDDLPGSRSPLLTRPRLIQRICPTKMFQFGRPQAFHKS